MILFGIIALAASLISIALAVAAAAAWASRPRPPSGGCGDVLAVSGVPCPGALESSTVRALAAADGCVRLRFAAGCLRDDTVTTAVLESVRREFPGLDASAIVTAPDHRKVAAPALVAAALAASDGDNVMLVDPWTRPSAHAVRALAGLAPDAVVIAAVPGRNRGDAGMFSIQADVSRLTPLLYALFGPRGVVPTIVLVPRRTLSGVFGDPLSLNRMSAGAAVFAACGREGMAPAHVDALCGAGPAFTHLASLARTGPVKYAASCMALSAAPLSLLSVVAGAAPGGPGFALGLTALVLAVSARTATGLTWRVGPERIAIRVLEGLASPVLDATALARLVSAAGTRTVRCGRASYRLHRDGLLSSGEGDHGSVGGRR